MDKDKKEVKKRFSNSHEFEIQKISYFLALRFKNEAQMKKYLLLIEDEKVWGRFKEVIDRDINTEILELIKKKIEKEEK